MNELENYFNIEALNQLAINEKIYYSPSVGWDKINSKKINNKRTEVLNDIIKKIKEQSYKFVPYKINLLIKNKDICSKKISIW